jgi:hypothetical protein
MCVTATIACVAFLIREYEYTRIYQIISAACVGVCQDYGASGTRSPLHMTSITQHTVIITL